MSTAVAGYAPSHLRLTRRGRVVFTLLIAVPLVVAALFALVNSGGAAASNETGSSLHYVTVQSGETLWQLAGEIAPAADPREVASEIVHLNNLSGSDIQAGERLAIPAQYSK
ncbi:MAG: LysM peptidoglycan-binding domain-containing protein [Actinomycetota bacterium]